jgi:hypothetical protein
MRRSNPREGEQMSKHTPGPWRWWGCKDGSYNPLNDYAQIAAVPNEHVAQLRLASVTEADLRLIVAAPDLLEALRSITDAADEKRVTAKHYEIARTAIAKATGEKE